MARVLTRRFLPLLKMVSIPAFLVLVFETTGCSPPYVAANFDKEYKPRTKSLAVGPVASSPYNPEAKKGADQLREAIYHELKARQNQYSVTIQPLEESNRRMTEAVLTDSAFAQMRSLELCQLLGVDAVLRGTLVDYQKKKLFLGGGVVVEITINHATFGQMIWHYKIDKPPQLFGNPAANLDELGKKVAKKFPFRK